MSSSSDAYKNTWDVVRLVHQVVAENSKLEEKKGENSPIGSRVSHLVTHFRGRTARHCMMSMEGKLD